MKDWVKVWLDDIYMGAYMSKNTLWEWHDNLQASLAWKKIQHPPKFLGWSLNGKFKKLPKSWSKKNQRKTKETPCH